MGNHVHDRHHRPDTHQRPPQHPAAPLATVLDRVQRLGTHMAPAKTAMPNCVPLLCVTTDRTTMSNSTNRNSMCKRLASTSWGGVARRLYISASRVHVRVRRQRWHAQSQTLVCSSQSRPVVRLR
ncbi:hypothetical protein MHPYR_440039 [uncultured Mycobacterium sp.]|uniref:Uncharacterized protein n=1 Tax=uncultured Mycobacterium sp. TaxID=171292 RepID=A0A1Y5PFM6_9MYCO|nr:hypothetical protein MHPYR_440039 [uncultured Mycobacterium sp.]